MMKSFGLLAVLAAVASAAYLPAGDESKDCPAGKCGSAAVESGAQCAKQCGQCPLAAAKEQSATACTAGECSGAKCSGEACATTACHDASATACQGCPAATAACADGKSCAVATSAESGSDAACTATACGRDCKDCPVTAAMKKLPQMTYQVGTEKVACPKAAEELAKSSATAVHYVVCDKTYEDEGEAKLALVEATEQFVAAYAQPKVCPESGNITVAGHKACCEGTAKELSEVAKAAMDKLQLTYLVGEKSCHCPVEAEKLAEESGDVTVYCVGEEKSACQVTARLNLARAKYRAAVVALMQAEAPATPTSQNAQGS